MASLVRLGTTVGLLAALFTAGVPLGGQQQVDGPDVPAVPHEKSEFAGTWDYNAEESINIQTGRQEQRPRSATQRGGAGAPPATGGGRSGVGGPSRGGGEFGAGGGLGGGSTVGPTPEMLRESRDMARDLLEVAERLTIAVTDDRVTMTDDLGRQRIYLTNNRKEKHQIAASRFEVRSQWQDSQLQQFIEGAFDFTMTQTYFLSPDSQRLFLIIRVGEVRRNRPQTGFNRVYDRVN